MQNFDEYFPLDSSICYLNHAAVSPWPKCTKQALDAFSNENITMGAAHYPKWLEIEQQCRERLAQLIGLKHTHEIALAKSTSEALSIIGYGIDWQAGDEIIISSHEFPSNRIIWESLSRFGVQVRVADFDVLEPIEAIKAHINNNTRLISMSTIQYASGIRVNLNALSQLCQKHDILLCLDAIQSLGAVPFDQQAIQADFIVADGHKWMMAAEGLALFYVKQARQNELKLHQFGWHMVHNRGNYDTTEWEPAHNATRFECGSPNMLGIHVLNASLGLIHDIGMDTIEEELQMRMDYLQEQIEERFPGSQILSPTESEKRGGILTFKPQRQDLKSLYTKLMKQGVICAYRGGGIRFSPHFYTTKESMDKAFDILSKLL